MGGDYKRLIQVLVKSPRNCMVLKMRPLWISHETWRAKSMAQVELGELRISMDFPHPAIWFPVFLQHG